MTEGMKRLLVVFISVLLFSPLSMAKTCTSVFLTDFSSYSLGQKALTHILDGEIVNSHNGPAIRGGLHTFPAFLSFLEQRPDITLLHQKNSPEWAFHMAVDNGVIYARLPESAYSSKALKSLWQSDMMATNGYLWKSLFPESMTKAEIFNAIKAVMAKPVDIKRQGWSTKLSGIVKRPQGDLVISVIVNNRDKSVVSAYPSVNQPGPSVKGQLPLGKMTVVNTMLHKTSFTHGITDAGYYHAVTEPIQAISNQLLAIGGRQFWDQLPPIVNQQLAARILRPSSNLTMSIPSFDMTLFRSRFNDGHKYPIGDYSRVAGEIFLRYLEDPTVPKKEKVSMVNAQLDNLIVNRQTMLMDILWIKTVINIIYQNRGAFDQQQWHAIMRKFFQSPAFWVTFIKTPLDSTVRSAPLDGLLYLMTQQYMGPVLRADFVNSDPKALTQALGVQRFIPTLYEVIKPEKLLIDEVLRLPELRPDGDNANFAVKILIDYINLSVLNSYFARFKIDSDQSQLNSSEMTKLQSIMGWEATKPDVLDALSTLETYSVKVEKQEYLDALKETFTNLANRPEKQGTHNVPALLIKGGGSNPQASLNNYQFTIGNFIPRESRHK